MKEVFVTGLGVMAPHGEDTDSVFAALMRGQSAVSAVFPDLAVPAAAAVVNFDETRWFSKLQLAGVDRVSQLAVAAAERAIHDAQLSISSLDATRIGVYLGCGMGGAASLDHAYRSTGRVPPLTIPAFMPNAPAAHVAMRWGLQGPVLTYSVACASSSIAIAEAAKAVRSGEVDVAIAGGAEALIVPGVVLAWQAMQTLAKFKPGEAAHACRPFASDRSGFVLGEGAAFMVLEPAEHARSRGREAYAHLAGWGIGCDATHLTKPDVRGQQRAMRQALALAGLSPADVGYCNAHGTATRAGDLVEAEALASVWGADLPTLRVSSTKGMHGHLLGAAGALEAVITVLALHKQQIPPNGSGVEVDPACAIPVLLTPGLADPNLQAAVSNTFAFGGTNAVLAFRRA